MAPLDLFDDGSRHPLEPVILPIDELAHKHTMEWWYFVAHLRATTTDDRVSVLLSAIRRDYGPNLTVCLLKITDHRRGAWPLFESGGLFDMAYEETTSPVTFRMRFGSPLEDAFTRNGAWEIDGRFGRYRISGHVGHDDAELDLTFRATHAAVPLCGEGIMNYGNGHRLAYYVRPKVEVTGRMDIGGIIQAVRGCGWYERQWGPWPEQEFGWKYLNIHLDDGEQVLAFHSNVGGARKLYAARFPREGGICEHRLRRDQMLDFPLLGRPSETELRLPTEDGPLVLHVVPLFPGEPPLDSRYPFVPTFWESVSRVEGTRGGSPVTGVAMTELHNYG